MDLQQLRVFILDNLPEKGWIKVAGIVVALNAFLFPHHDIQTIVFCPWRRVLVHDLAQVPAKSWGKVLIKIYAMNKTTFLNNKAIYSVVWFFQTHR